MFEGLDQTSIICIILILLAPIVWNGIARLEYSTKLLSYIFGNNVKACYFLASVITIVSRTRDLIFFIVVLRNKNEFFIPFNLNYYFGSTLFVLGLLFVITSIHKLGFLCTHMGDHFGIYLDAKVTSFPFNILENPMYMGSAIAMFGVAVFFKSFIGIKLAMFTFVIYNLFSKLYEENFTNKIYQERMNKEKIM